MQKVVEGGVGKVEGERRRRVGKVWRGRRGRWREG